MKNIDGRPRDIGGFQVRRFLPSRACPSVGPFVFFDHAGPTYLEPGHGLDVLPHPHIGLATVTYILEGGASFIATAWVRIRSSVPAISTG